MKIAQWFLSTSSAQWSLPCLCPQGELLLSVASCLGGGLSKISFFQFIASFKLLLLPLDPEHVRFYVCYLRMESLFPPTLWVSKTHWPSKPNVVGTCLPGVEPLDWGAHCGAQSCQPFIIF